MYPATVPPHKLIGVGVLQTHTYQVPCGRIEGVTGMEQKYQGPPIYMIP